MYCDKQDRRYEPAALRYLERLIVEGRRCSETGRGWIGEITFDLDDGEPPKVIVFCPPSAASEFGYRPDLAESYVCVWEPLPSEATDQ